MSKFKIGDVINPFPKMTIDDINDEEATCVFFREGKLYRTYLPVAELEKCQPV